MGTDEMHVSVLDILWCAHQVFAAHKIRAVRPSATKCARGRAKTVDRRYRAVAGPLLPRTPAILDLTESGNVL